MNRCTGSFIVCFLSVTTAFSQVDSLNSKKLLPIFDRVTKSLKEYKLDTSEVPNDKITKMIIELRNLRGGFNINEAINFKLEEDKQKKEIPEADFERFSHFFKNVNIHHINKNFFLLKIQQ